MMKRKIASILVLVLIVSLMIPITASAAGPYDATLTLTGPDKDGNVVSVSSDASYIAETLTLQELVTSFGDLAEIARSKFSGTGLYDKFMYFYDAARTGSDEEWVAAIAETTVTPKDIIPVIEDRKKTVADFLAVSDYLVATFETENGDTYTAMLAFDTGSGINNGRGGTGSGTGSGSKSFAASLGDMKNGTATLSSSKAKKGETVIVTPAPNKGFEVDAVVVTDEDGKKIDVKKNTDGTYSFTMPEGKVNVNVTFKESAQESESTGLPFEDVKETDWFYQAVLYCYEQGWFKGLSVTEFDPDGPLTRSMFVTVMWRIAGEPQLLGENPFDDVGSSQWFTQAVIWAYDQGIMVGYGNGQFGTLDNLTREQLITVLWRMAGKPAGTGDLSKFKDAADISPWAKEAMSWAVGLGWVQGDETGALNPGKDATRAEIAQILMNSTKK